MTTIKPSPVTAQAEQATVQVMVESNNNGMKTQGSATPDSNSGANENSNMMELTKGTIYVISVLVGKGYSFGRIKINRDIDEKQVKKKITSIQACNGVISPFLVVTAEDCLKAGLELVDEKEIPITKDTPNLDFILIVLDGQHRLEALRQLNKKLKKEGKPEYEGYVYLPLIDDYDVPTLLREANSATKPWDGMDWLTQLLATSTKKGFATEKLEWVKDKAKNGSDSAAWAWVNDGKTYSKASCIKASKDDQKLEELADVSSFEKDKKLYDSASKSFTGESAKVLGWKVLPVWIYKNLDSLVKRDYKRSDAMELLSDFLGNIGSDAALEISNIKRTANQNKDNLIIAKLNKMFNDFKKNKNE